MSYDKKQRRFTNVSVKEINLWIDNDKGLYDWWKESRLSKREFIRQNSKDLKAAILAQLNATPIRPRLY